MTRKCASQLRSVIRAAVWLGWLAVAQAQQLPIKSYTTADGLPQNHANRIKRDSRGYLWICTDEGLVLFNPEASNDAKSF